MMAAMKAKRHDEAACASDAVAWLRWFVLCGSLI